MRTIQGDGNDLYLDCKGGYMHVYVFQDSSNCTCKVDALGEKGEHMQKRISPVCVSVIRGKAVASQEDLTILGDGILPEGLDR